MRIILEVSTRDQKVIHLLTRLLEGGGGVRMDTDQALRGRAVYARMLVRQQPVQFQVDCSASPNILPLKYAEGERDSCLQTLVMWNGTKVTPNGSCALPVVNQKTNEKYKVRFLVMKEDLTPLLGLNAMQKMKLLTVHKENFINVVGNANDDCTANYVDVFNKGL